MRLITRSKGNTALASISYENTGDMPVSVAEVNVWAKVSGQDSEVEDLIKETVDIAENEFNLSIIDKTVTAIYSDYGSVVRLPFAPVKEIVSVKSGDDEKDYKLIGNELHFDTWGGELEVIYETGYDTLPQGLKLAVKKAVLSAFEDRQDTVLGSVGLIPQHSRALFKRYMNY